MMKKNYLKIKHALIITLIINALISNFTLAKSKSFAKDTLNLLAKSNSENSQENAGTNTGRSVAGGTRTGSCPQKNISLLAINHNQGSDLTISPYPTFWFYVPYTSNEINKITFSLNNEKERKTIFSTLIQLTDKPGIIKIRIPSQPEYILEEKQEYHWSLDLDCKPNPKEDSNQQEDFRLSMDGYIMRVKGKPELKNQLKVVNYQNYIVYRKNGIWHDAITNLAELYFNDPKNEELYNEWVNLLELLKLKTVETDEQEEKNIRELTREQLEKFGKNVLVGSELLPTND